MLAYARERAHARLRRTRLRRVDHRLFAELAARRHPFLDAVLPRVSAATDWSLGWYATAAGLAAGGGAGGRRAATSGVLAIWLASLTVNHPVKLVARRQRPDLALVPEIRRLAAQPGSWSFPSGHTASAFAFATAVSRELPAAALPMLAAAAAVGLSRVNVGAHYPSDVLVGAAAGTLVGLAAPALRRHAPRPGPPRTSAAPVRTAEGVA